MRGPMIEAIFLLLEDMTLSLPAHTHALKFEHTQSDISPMETLALLLVYMLPSPSFLLQTLS